MIRLCRACRGRTAVRFPAKSSHMCCVELPLIKGVLSTRLGSKRSLLGVFFKIMMMKIFMTKRKVMIMKILLK